EPSHPLAQHAGVADPWKPERGAVACERRQQAPAGIEGARDQDQGARAEPRNRRQHLLLVLRRQGFGPAHDQRLGSAEQHRRRQVVEGGRESLPVVPAPHGAHARRSPGRCEPAAKHRQRALDEEDLLSVQEVCGAQRLPIQGGQRVRAARLTGRTPAGGPQNASTACRYTSLAIWPTSSFRFVWRRTSLIWTLVMFTRSRESIVPSWKCGDAVTTMPETLPKSSVSVRSSLL